MSPKISVSEHYVLDDPKPHLLVMQVSQGLKKVKPKDDSVYQAVGERARGGQQGLYE